MKLDEILSQKKPAVLQRWRELIQETYSAETAVFLKKGGDPFQNPVADTFRRSTDSLFASLFGGKERDEILSSLDAIVRIRAVQEFSPSQAVAFVFLLKTVVREELKAEVQSEGLHDDLLELESKIDGLALLAFDCYSKCRERIHELRAGEMKRKTHRLLEKSSWVTSNSDVPPLPEAR